MPYAAYKLLRVMRGAKFLGPAWKGWHVRHDRLYTPEGHVIEATGMAWWSLIVRQAREFQRTARDRRLEDGGAPAPAAAGAVRERPVASTAGDGIRSALSAPGVPQDSCSGLPPSQSPSAEEGVKPVRLLGDRGQLCPASRCLTPLLRPAKPPSRPKASRVQACKAVSS
ncbi:hypothetical protein INQ43_06520 [Lysobacter sp. H23M47]|nr:hypothetical protein INQ43_06520 [Lysobacter sp. H23M47]